MLICSVKNNSHFFWCSVSSVVKVHVVLPHGQYCYMVCKLGSKVRKGCHPGDYGADSKSNFGNGLVHTIPTGKALGSVDQCIDGAKSLALCRACSHQCIGVSCDNIIQALSRN